LAIPRGTVLGFEIGLDRVMAENRRLPDNVDSIIIDAVSDYFKYIGIGGMGTRGFGRLEIIQIKAKEKRQ